MERGKCPDLQRELQLNQSHVCGYEEPVVVVRRHRGSCPRCKREESYLDQIRDKRGYIEPSLLVDLLGDISRGVDQYGDYESLKQALYVIRGEWYELRDEFEHEPPILDRLRAEALDLAATCVRFAEEIDRGSFQETKEKEDE